MNRAPAPRADLPNTLPRPDGELAELQRAWARPPGWRALSAINNTFIGRLYIATALLFLVLAGILGLMMRAQLAVPGATWLSPGTYNQVFTMHGTVMMFLFAVPIVEAIAVFLLPNMLGARDLPFPRLSAYAYWAYAFGGLAFFCTLFVGLAPDGGWFMYPPLTSRVHSPGLNADFWLLGIGFIEISAIAGAIELIIGILMTRAPGMTLSRMPVYAWSMLIVGVMIVLAFPAVIAGTALLEMERAFDWPLFDPRRGGDPLLWQHLFWFFGHPEVYIIFLPAAGMVSAMLPALVGRPLVGHRAIVAALAAVGCFSFALWAHHMFTAGLGTLAVSLVSVASLAVAVPAAVQVFAWVATLWRGQVRANTPTLFIIGFLLTFVIGGLTGVMVAVLPFDWQVHDSYFIVAHLHYVLIGGLVFPLFAALYHWMPLHNGWPLSERWGRWVFALCFLGFHITFFPMHLLGLWGMPRRIYTYDQGLGWDGANLLASGGALMLAAGVLLLLLDLIRTARRPGRPVGNPWRSPSLEWLPQQAYGPRSVPQVRSLWPLWRQRTLAQEVEAGAHWLPGTVTGRRETLITHPRSAELRHLIVLPEPSWWPLLAALGTAGFFLLLTVKATIPAALCGVLAVVGTWIWLWQGDRPMPGAKATGTGTGTVGQSVVVPIGAARTASHTWWATVILLVVDASVLGSMVFTHLHLAMRLDVCPPPGSALPSWWDAAVPVVAGFALSAALVTAALRGLGRQALPRWRIATVGLALVVLVWAFGGLLSAMSEVHLRPTDHAWAASIAALLAYLGLHTVLCMAVAVYLAARIWRGWVGPGQRATADNSALLWWNACAHGVLVTLTPYAVQGMM